MKENPILSIIIPSYNVSKYVDECLPTFIDERFRGLLKIYLIDDGATDDTKEKIAPYVAKYPYIFEFIHKENGGHGSVINYGVYNCVKSKYFKVIDGDDWVDPNELFKLICYLEKNDDDLIVSNYVEIYSNGNVNKKVCCKDAFNNFTLNDLVLTIHSVSFKTSLFTENNIKLRENVFFEDNEYVLFPLQYVKNFSYVPYDVYKYRLGNSNQSVSPISISKRYSHLELVANDIAEEYLKIKEKDNLNISLSQFEKSLYFFFINDYIHALSISNTKREFIHIFKVLDEKRNKYKRVYDRIEKNIKYKILKNIWLFPYKFIKKHLAERYC